MEVNLTPMIYYLNGFLPDILQIMGIGIAISGAFYLFSFLVRAIILWDEKPTKKKSYQDEMSIYDHAPVDAIQSLPQTGVSLDNLIDGELPDSAFKRGEHG